MNRICMYCKKVFGHKEGEGDTHGVCPPCAVKQWEKLMLVHVLSCLCCEYKALHINYITPRCKRGKEIYDLWVEASINEERMNAK